MLGVSSCCLYVYAFMFQACCCVVVMFLLIKLLYSFWYLEWLVISLHFNHKHKLHTYTLPLACPLLPFRTNPCLLGFYNCVRGLQVPYSVCTLLEHLRYYKMKIRRRQLECPFIKSCMTVTNYNCDLSSLLLCLCVCVCVWVFK